MNGLMMQQPLLISSLLTHAERHHGEQEIVSRRVEGDIHRYTYRELGPRAAPHGQRAGGARHRASATASPRWPGTATATWSCTTRSRARARCCTRSTRGCTRPGGLDRRPCRGPGPVLRPDLPAAGRGDRRRVKTIKAFVAMTDRATCRPASVPNLLCYEELIEPPATEFDWPSSTRTPPRRCATPRARPATRRARSTATARPCCTPTPAALPGRAQLLGARRHPAGGADVPRQRLGPALRRLHGRRQAGLPGPVPRRQVAARAVRERRASPSRPACRRSGRACWPTSRPTTSKFSTMRRTIIGGSACPPAMMRAFQERYDVQVLHAWGMTEMSPLGTVCTLKPST